MQCYLLWAWPSLPLSLKSAPSHWVFLASSARLVAHTTGTKSVRLDFPTLTVQHLICWFCLFVCFATPSGLQGLLLTLVQILFLAGSGDLWNAKDWTWVGHEQGKYPPLCYHASPQHFNYITWAPKLQGDFWVSVHIFPAIIPSWCPLPSTKPSVSP